MGGAATVILGGQQKTRVCSRLASGSFWMVRDCSGLFEKVLSCSRLFKKVRECLGFGKVLGCAPNRARAVLQQLGSSASTAGKEPQSAHQRNSGELTTTGTGPAPKMPPKCTKQEKKAQKRLAMKQEKKE